MMLLLTLTFLRDGIMCFGLRQIDGDRGKECSYKDIWSTFPDLELVHGQKDCEQGSYNT